MTEAHQSMRLFKPIYTNYMKYKCKAKGKEQTDGLVVSKKSSRHLMLKSGECLRKTDVDRIEILTQPRPVADLALIQKI